MGGFLGYGRVPTLSGKDFERGFARDIFGPKRPKNYYSKLRIKTPLVIIPEPFPDKVATLSYLGHYCMGIILS